MFSWWGREFDPRGCNTFFQWPFWYILIGHWFFSNFFVFFLSFSFFFFFFFFFFCFLILWFILATIVDISYSIPTFESLFGLNRALIIINCSPEKKIKKILLYEKLGMCQYDTDAPAQGHTSSKNKNFTKMKLKRAITLIIMGGFLL